MALFDLDQKKLEKVKETLKGYRLCGVNPRQYEEEKRGRKKGHRLQGLAPCRVLPRVVDSISVYQALLAFNLNLAKLDEKSKKALRLKFDEILERLASFYS